MRSPRDPIKSNLCHNLVVLIHETRELGIDSVLLSESARKILLILSALVLTVSAVVASGRLSQARNQNKRNFPQEKAASVAAYNNQGLQAGLAESSTNSAKWYAALKSPEWWLVIAAFLTLGFVAWQAWETKRAVRGAAESVEAINRQAAIMERQASEMEQQRGVMQGQLETMKGQLELEHRPWVGIENPIVMGSALAFVTDGAHVQTRFQVANKGTAPATNVAAQAQLVIKAHAAVDLNPLDRLVNNVFFVCATTFPMMLHNSHFGIFLLPGSQNDLAMTEWRADASDIPQSGLVEVFLVGSIGYSDEFGKPHGTSFVYQYVRQDRRTTFPPGAQIHGGFEIFGLSKAY